MCHRVPRTSFAVAAQSSSTLERAKLLGGTGVAHRRRMQRSSLAFASFILLGAALQPACGHSSSGADSQTSAVDSGAATGADSGSITEQDAAGQVVSEAGSNAATCVVAPRANDALPHVTASGTEAAAVVHAIDSILRLNTPSIEPAKQSYVADTVVCENVTAATPNRATGYGCSLALAVDGGPAVAVDVPSPSKLAQDLYAALQSAGGSKCIDYAHGEFIRAKNFAANISASSSTANWDDVSNYSSPSSPNVVVDGASASGILSSFSNAKVADCDPSARAFVICTADQGTPSCSVLRDTLTDVSGSKLVYTCNPQGGEPQPAVALSDGDSRAVWAAITAAASAVNFAPLNGTIAQATVLNARYFQFDGVKLGFNLTLDDASAPPPPPPTAPPSLSGHP